jgi:hypothetical protein
MKILRTRRISYQFWEARKEAREKPARKVSVAPPPGSVVGREV